MDGEHAILEIVEKFFLETTELGGSEIESHPGSLTSFFSPIMFSLSDVFLIN